MPPKVTPDYGQDYLLAVSNGDVPGAKIVTKFGRNKSPSTSALSPCCLGGVYQTPTTIQALEILSDDANDTAAGSGAQSVFIQGLSTNYEEVTETVEMNGTTIRALANSYFRVYRLYVNRSGTYATATASSQAGTITLRGTGAGATWAVIDTAVTGFGIGQSQIGMYSVPAGKTASLLGKVVTVETGATKEITFYFMRRENIDDVSTPFTGTMRLVEQHDGIVAPLTVWFPAPITTFPEKTDIGFFLKASAANSIATVDFQLLVLDM